MALSLFTHVHGACRGRCLISANHCPRDGTPIWTANPARALLSIESCRPPCYTRDGADLLRLIADSRAFPYGPSYGPSSTLDVTGAVPSSYYHVGVDTAPTPRPSRRPCLEHTNLRKSAKRANLKWRLPCLIARYRPEPTDQGAMHYRRWRVDYMIPRSGAECCCHFHAERMRHQWESRLSIEYFVGRCLHTGTYVHAPRAYAVGTLRLRFSKAFVHQR